MKLTLPKNTIPVITGIIIFFVISLAYFSPVMDNKVLFQGDVTNWKGMSKEIQDYKEETGKHALWTNSMFSGMPTYLINNPPSKNILLKLHKVLNLFFFKPVNQLFVLFIGFFISLLILRINPWLSLAGAIAFAFSTGFINLIGAGHVTKVMAIGYMTPIIAGIYITYRGKLLLGSVITGVFLSLQLAMNHLQMTYYTLMIVVVLGFVELYNAFKNKQLPVFFKATGILVIVAMLAVATNFANFWLTYEYSKYTIRGESELSGEENIKTRGLDRDYVVAWSNGIDEILTLFIPNFKGGASGASVGENSESYKHFKQIYGEKNAKQIIKQLPLYWGSKPFTGGPTYVGAGVFFLFILGLVLIRGPMKWWLLIISVLAIMLSWGRNFMWFTNIFLDYLPGYNKFRDVTMLLIITQVTIPLLGILTFQRILQNNINKDEFLKALKYSVIGVGGLTLLFVLIPGVFYDFSYPADKYYPKDLVNALVADREMMLRNDSIRSLVFIGLTAGLVYLTYTKKIKANLSILILIVIILQDLYTVDKRYLNKDDFVSKNQVDQPYRPMQADLAILADTTYYRVFEKTADPFKSARASYFHKSIGGYHGAKLRRYQDLYDHHLSKDNMAVINMLNTKYIIENPKQEQLSNGQRQPPIVQRNLGALGNAWFVNQYRIVENPDEEINALSNFNPAKEAIIDKRFASYIENLELIEDTSATIRLTSYKPDGLTYETQSSRTQLAVFSEIYYEKGWNVLIDGEPEDHFRVNYVLRAMVIPPGHHTLEFSFQPKGYTIGRTIGLISSLILLFLLLGVIGFEIKNYIKNPETEEV